MKEVKKALSNPLIKLTLGEVNYVVKYLKRFGYIDDNFKAQDVLDAVVKFQSFFSLKKDGVLGPKTFKAMTEKRCGVVDCHPKGLAAQSKWGKLKLTYSIQQRLDEFSGGEFKDILDEAWRAWEKHCKIRISYVEGQSDIVISTGNSRQEQFDGAGGVLAWAQLPNGSNGQLLCKFDTSETWLKSGENSRGIYLLNVATHEFGHLLGLNHSQVKTALMAPYYNPGVADPQLNDDVTRIQAVYGKNDGDVPPTPSPPLPPTPTDTHIQMWVKSISEIKIPGYRVVKI